MSQFLNKSVVITGGCTGIGYEVVKQLLMQEAKNVAVLDVVHTNNSIDALQAEFKNQNVIFIKTDISKKDQVQDAFKEIIKKFNSIDIVLCNAGILNDRDYEKSVNVNLLGTIHTVFTAMDVMSKANGGNGGLISMTSSVSGLEPLFSIPVYCATKSAIISLGRSLSNEFYFNKHGIKFVTLCPSSTSTNFAEDFASRVADIDALIASKSVTHKRIEVQSAEAAGKCFVEKLANSENGSIWIVENGQSKEVNMSSFWDSENL